MARKFRSFVILGFCHEVVQNVLKIQLGISWGRKIKKKKKSRLTSEILLPSTEKMCNSQIWCYRRQKKRLTAIVLAVVASEKILSCV